MSELEAKRLMRAIPNPGKGILDGDDAITYQAKLEQLMYETELAYARNVMLMKYGVGGQMYTADQIMADMNQDSGIKAYGDDGKPTGQNMRGAANGKVLDVGLEDTETFLRGQWEQRKQQAMASGYNDAQAEALASQSMQEEFKFSGKREAPTGGGQDEEYEQYDPNPQGASMGIIPR
jgi:hypothetical protein